MGESVRQSMAKALGDVQFSVVKVNGMGRKQKRILRFTAGGIQNIKNGSVVTKQFAYADVANVRLVNADELVIAYDTDHDFVYRSTDAVVIVQELSRRLHLHHSRAFHRIAVEFQRAVANPNGPDHLTRFSDKGQGDELSFLVHPALAVDVRSSAPSLRDQVAMDVTRWVFQRNSPEGRTTAHFVRKFSAKSTVPSVRVFLDGMCQYIMEEREKQLLALVHNAMEPEHIELVVEEVLQEAVVVPLWDQIVALMRDETMTKKENLITMKCLSLRSMHQLGFGVEPELLSPTNWAIVVRQFQEIEKGHTPCEMLANLLQATRSIYRLHQLEHPPVQGEEQFMGADQFLPVFIFVVVQACLQRPVFVTEVLWLLSSPPVLAGEAGYYLTVFQSALEYLVRADVEALLVESERLAASQKGRRVGLPKLSLARPQGFSGSNSGAPRGAGSTLLSLPSALASAVRDRRSTGCKGGGLALNKLSDILPAAQGDRSRVQGPPPPSPPPQSNGGEPQALHDDPLEPDPPLSRIRERSRSLPASTFAGESAKLDTLRPRTRPRYPPPKFTNSTPASAGPLLDLPHRSYTFAVHQSNNIEDDD